MLNQSVVKMRDMCTDEEQETMKLTEDRFILEGDITVLKERKNHLQEKQNHLSKCIEDEKKLFKKMEYENNNVGNNIKELSTQQKVTQKFIEEKKKENTAILENKKNLDEEQ